MERSAAGPLGNAAAEFCRYTAPSALSRRHTVARSLVGSVGTR